jgi:hypothetical protein
LKVVQVKTHHIGMYLIWLKWKFPPKAAIQNKFNTKSFKKNLKSFNNHLKSQSGTYPLVKAESKQKESKKLQSRMVGSSS